PRRKLGTSVETASGRGKDTQCVGPLRHARQRRGVVRGLVQPELSARHPRRIVDGRREIASRVGPRQGDANNERLLDRFTDREGSKMSTKAVRTAAGLAIVLL